MSSKKFNLSNLEWKKAALTSGANLSDAIRSLENSSLKLILVLEDDILVGTLSDGDVRRGILKGLTLVDPIKSLINRNPVVVGVDAGKDVVLNLMLSKKIQQIPIVDLDRKIIGVHKWEDVAGVVIARPNTMIVMAGGLGKRLMPLTLDCPKPMLKIAGKPMLEHIIERAKLDGFKKFIFSINYLGDVIKDYFGDGEKFGVSIDYISESSPLGTAGALSLIEKKLSQPFLVTNGDVLSEINYGNFLDFHLANNSVASMAVRVHEWQNPYGVVYLDGIKIINFEEKPISKSYINAGVYVLSPEVLDYFVRGVYCDMPDIFRKLSENKMKVIAYPVHESWLDIGRPEDLILANQQIEMK